MERAESGYSGGSLKFSSDLFFCYLFLLKDNKFYDKEKRSQKGVEMQRKCLWVLELGI